MTSRPTWGQATYASSRPYYPQRPSGFGHSFGGGLLTGLVAGGLVGHFLGHGYGYGWGGYGGGGLIASLFQLALLGGGIWLLMQMFGGGRRDYHAAQTPTFAPGFGSATEFGPAAGSVDLPVTSADQAEFEFLLGQLQDAFSREDYGALRAITTPEVMSYLAEELSENATHGRRNEVSGTRLISGDVSEAWEEDGLDYVTVALQYESMDVMRDRATGAILSGSATTPTETTELWTFVRPSGSYAGWKVSAIQEA